MKEREMEVDAYYHTRVCQSSHIISAETDARGSFKIRINTRVLNRQVYEKIWGRGDTIGPTSV
jgi:hypothetical protein